MKKTDKCQPTQLSILHMWSKDKNEEQSPGNPIPIMKNQSLSSDTCIEKSDPVLEADEVSSSPRQSLVAPSEQLDCPETRATSRHAISKSSVITDAEKKSEILNKQDFAQDRLFPIFSKGTRSADGLPVEHAESTTRTGKKIHARTVQRRSGYSRTTSAANTSNTRETSTFIGPSSQSIHSSAKTSTKDVEFIDLTDNDKSGSPSFVLEEGKSAERPIVVEISPSATVNTSSNVLRNNFFAPTKSSISIKRALSRKSRKKAIGEGDDAVWPNTDSQHVRGGQELFPSKSLDYVLKSSRKLQRSYSYSYDREIWLRSNSDLYPQTQQLRRNCYVEELKSQVESRSKIYEIVRECNDYPAITRFSSTETTLPTPSQELWTSKWRPWRAAEVIGNETSALFLRDWLLALQLQSYSSTSEGPSRQAITSSQTNNGATLGIQISSSKPAMKKRNIIRFVDKSRRKKRRIDSDDESLDNWINDDDDDDDDDLDCEPQIDDSMDKRSNGSKNGSPWKPKLTRLSRKQPPEPGPEDKETQFDVTGHQDPPGSTSNHDFSDFLTNTILLAGPSGTGKTAAIYACAEELGWEVFEVYPGIGKRNGASILSLVGDVGKNHIVGKSGGNVPAVFPLASSGMGKSYGSKEYVVNGIQGQDSSGSPGVKANILLRGANLQNGDGCKYLGQKKVFRSQSPLEERGFNFLPSNAASEKQSGVSTRQSIILLEEVDVLFGEDVNFWPTVVTLIKESRRPVIMTCNDIGTIPLSDLPLQTVLAFKPCPADIATSYLRCVGLAEGYAATEELAKALYNNLLSPNSTDAFGSLTHTSNQQIRQTPDLRRAINALQLLCRTTPEPTDGAQNTTALHMYNIDGCVPPIGVYDNDVPLFDELCDWRDSPLSGHASLTECNAHTKLEQLTPLAHRLVRFAETMSMIDSHLERRPSILLEALSSEGNAQTDLEVGYHHVMAEPAIMHLQGGIPIFNRDESIAQEAMYCAKKMVGINNRMPDSGSGPSASLRTDERIALSTSALPEQRSRFLSRISDVLESVMPAVSLRAVDELVLDYEPWVRKMDEADGVLEAAAMREMEARAAMRVGRLTRNSQRQKYTRYFNLTEGQRACLRDTAFRVDDTFLGADHELATDVDGKS